MKNIDESNRQYEIWARRNGFWTKNICECDERQTEELLFRGRVQDAIGDRVLQGTHVNKRTFDAIMQGYMGKVTQEQELELLRLLSDSMPDEEIDFSLLELFGIKPI